MIRMDEKEDEKINALEKNQTNIYINVNNMNNVTSNSLQEVNVIDKNMTLMGCTIENTNG